MTVVLVWFWQAGTIDATGRGQFDRAVDKNQANSSSWFVGQRFFRKKDMPFCIIKVSLCRLEKLMHKKTASCVALTAVRKK